MTILQLLTVTWDFEPSVLVGCALLLVLHVWVSKGRPLRSFLLFTAGDLVLAFALVSPLDELGDTYLFSAHMLQHLLLVLLAPPLLIAGLPESPLRRMLERGVVRRSERLLSRPPIAWTLGIGTLWIWHLPVLYNATLASERIHIFEHLTFLVTGVVFWWPIFTPLEDRRYPASTALFYLGLGALANTVLGVLLTFAPPGFYPYYLHPRDPYHALGLIRNSWGLDAAADQQLGGVFMWVFGAFFFLGAIVIVLRRWFNTEEPEDAAARTMKPAKVSRATDARGGHPRD